MTENHSQNDLYHAFVAELNYKIWSTKECRFNANKRLLKLSKTAHQCRQILLVYSVVVFVLFGYNMFFGELFIGNVLSSTITFLLIILLVLNQIETTKDYHTKAEEFHTCGLELSSLYNALLIFKTLIDNQPLEDKKQFTHKLAESYQRILAMHENHEPIDTAVFKSKAAKYHNLNWIDVQIIKIKYYINTSLLFHLLIVLPPILFAILMIQ